MLRLTAPGGTILWHDTAAVGPPNQLRRSSGPVVGAPARSLPGGQPSVHEDVGSGITELGRGAEAQHTPTARRPCAAADSISTWQSPNDRALGSSEGLERAADGRGVGLDVEVVLGREHRLEPVAEP
jgi:hypothetical protein